MTHPIKPAPGGLQTPREDLARFASICGFDVIALGVALLAHYASPEPLMFRRLIPHKPNPMSPVLGGWRSPPISFSSHSTTRLIPVEPDCRTSALR